MKIWQSVMIVFPQLHIIPTVFCFVSKSFFGKALPVYNFMAKKGILRQTFWIIWHFRSSHLRQTI